MKNRIIPVLITLILIVVVGFMTGKELLADYLKGSTELIDYNEVYELNDQEYLVVLNHQIQTQAEGDSEDSESIVYEKGIERDGAVYLDTQYVAGHINSRFYWDSNEKIFIYTTATQILKAYPDEAGYHVGEEFVSLNYVPVKTINVKDENGEISDKVYVSTEYIKLFTQCEIEVYDDNRRIDIVTKWGEIQTVTAAEDAPLRYTDGRYDNHADKKDEINIKHPIVKNVAEGETLIVLGTNAETEWTKASTQDGYIGWIQNKFITEAQTVTTTAPAFEEEEFTYIKEDGKICLAWHQVTNEYASSVNNLVQALNNTSDITVVAPTWFCFDGNEGHIQSIASNEYVSYAHQLGKKVWAVFANSSSPGGAMDGINTDKILSYTSKREIMVSELITEVLNRGIDGINLDFEAITLEGADNYIQFVRELSVACRNNGICLSIDNYVPLYTRHYDRAEQAKFADYLVIMGYDQYGGFAPDQAGPGASLPFVQQGIEETLEIIGGDASKVINGIPFYTNIWEEGRFSFIAIMGEAKGYLKKYPDSTIMTWNAELGYNYAYYTSPLNSHTISMWLEDAESIAAKLELMSRYDLAGVAVWKLQQEDADVWDAISAYMNSEVIPTHDIISEIPDETEESEQE